MGRGATENVDCLQIACGKARKKSNKIVFPLPEKSRKCLPEGLHQQ